MIVRQSKIDKLILDYCKQHNIKLLIDPMISKNDGLCYPTFKEIHLAKSYTSLKIKFATFLHEVAHISVERLKAQPYNIFECEYYSWFYAMKLHKKLLKKSFNKLQTEYMLRCLKSYCRSHYEFRKTLLPKDDGFE